MKLAIIGSRHLTFEHLGDYIPAECTEIVSGGASGIDTCAAQYAKEHDLKLTVFLPEYDKYRRNAPLIRNKQIVDYADHVLALWDGDSKGTGFALNYCKKQKKAHTVMTLTAKGHVLCIMPFERDYTSCAKKKSITVSEALEDETTIERLEQAYQQQLEQHLEKDKPELLPKAQENLLAVQNACDALAKKHCGTVRTDISFENHSAILTLQLPLLDLSTSDYCTFASLQTAVSDIQILPLRAQLHILVHVRYFSESDSPGKMAWSKAYQKISAHP